MSIMMLEGVALRKLLLSFFQLVCYHVELKSNKKTFYQIFVSYFKAGELSVNNPRSINRQITQWKFLKVPDMAGGKVFDKPM